VKYVNQTVAQSMAKEFLKGAAKGILFELFVYEAEIEIRYLLSE